jgi:acetoin utilization deacetylase AcuC-like enzyme
MERPTSAMFRKVVLGKLIPALRNFKPDLLFISAGFDGHANDLIGQCG